jgi:hypothetical protein
MICIGKYTRIDHLVIIDKIIAQVLSICCDSVDMLCHKDQSSSTIQASVLLIISLTFLMFRAFVCIIYLIESR